MVFFPILLQVEHIALQGWHSPIHAMAGTSEGENLLAEHTCNTSALEIVI